MKSSYSLNRTSLPSLPSLSYRLNDNVYMCRMYFRRELFQHIIVFSTFFWRITASRGSLFLNSALFWHPSILSHTLGHIASRRFLQTVDRNSLLSILLLHLFYLLNCFNDHQTRNFSMTRQTTYLGRSADDLCYAIPLEPEHSPKESSKFL